MAPLDQAVAIAASRPDTLSQPKPNLQSNGPTPGLTRALLRLVVVRSVETMQTEQAEQRDRGERQSAGFRDRLGGVAGDCPIDLQS